jgi:hypothetical protein
VKLLQVTQLFNVVFQKLFIVLPGLVERLDSGSPVAELEVLPGRHPEIFRIDLHLVPFRGCPAGFGLLE